MSALADLPDADLIDPLHTEIVRRSDPLRDNASPSAQSLVNCWRYALIGLTQAEERLRADAATDLSAADLPAIDEPRVPRRPHLGGDPTRPLDAKRLPPGRYHP
ncbi:hypothetical protein [Methylorubrum extorquens]